MCVPVAPSLLLVDDLATRRQMEAGLHEIESGLISLQQAFQQAHDFFNFGQRDVAFFETGDSNYLSEREASVNTVLGKLNRFSGSVTPEVRLEIDEFLTLLEAYNGRLNELITLLHQRGFADFGLVGEMRGTIHELEAEVTDPGLMVHMLNLRRFEKDYIIRNQQKYVDALLDGAVMFRREIAATDAVNDAQRQELTRLLDKYTSTLVALVELDTVIGIRGRGGLFLELYDMEMALNKEYRQIQSTYTNGMVAKIEGLSERMMWAIAVVAILAIAMSVMFSQHLTLPLRKLSGRIREFVDSDFRQETAFNPGGGSREMRQIAEDFQVLQRTMIESLDSLEAQRAATEAANTELIEKRKFLGTAQKMARLAYWRWDISRQKLAFSDDLETICGTSLDPEGDPIPQLLSAIHPEDRERFESDVDTCLTSGETTEADYRLLCPGETEKWVRQNVSIEDSTGVANDAPVVIAAVQDVTEQRNAEAQVRKMAYYDLLTGLATRGNLNRRLNDMIRSARRRDEGFALFFIDLDKFKEINDSLGHDAGDQLLVEVSRRLEKTARNNDFIARLGGDEFCMLLENVDNEDDIVRIAERCISNLEENLSLSERDIKPQASIGIARYPVDGEDAKSLMMAGDNAMYEAKKNGFHSFAFHDVDMTRDAAKRLQLAQELRTAVREEQFELHYQPQVSPVTGEICAFEALVRWCHPERGLVPPFEFIPEVERLGLIKELGDWVIRRACRQVVEWREMGLPDTRICVNIAPPHLKDRKLVATVREALASTGIQPHQLEIEVTETGIQSGPESVAVLEEIQKLGIEVAIDDFGTGYSSLGSLKYLPADCLKIDRCFVREAATNTEDAILLETILTLGHSLDFRIVAEGVEDADQLAVLRGMGCELVQGYYFSRPVPADQVPAIMRRQFADLVAPSSSAA